MTRSRAYSHEEIQAYLDDELDSGARAAIQAAIDSDQNLARLVDEFRHNDEMLRQLDISALETITPAVLENIVRGPAPLAKSRSAALQPVNRRIYNFARGMAAAVVLVAIGFTSAQFIKNPFVKKDMSGTWIYRAVGAHKVYTQDAKRPFEMAADRQEKLLDWVSNRVGAPVRNVSLDDFGYRYFGGRLVTDGFDPAGQLQFVGGPGRKITIFVRRRSSTSKPKTKLVKIGGIKAVMWSEGQLDYAVIGQVPEKELFSIARANGG